MLKSKLYYSENHRQVLYDLHVTKPVDLTKFLQCDRCCHVTSVTYRYETTIVALSSQEIVYVIYNLDVG